ncbi:MAG: CPBP family intramembrane metalloprotease [Deltaproteobacteria bacterium]|nr:CPBP family intramembrane metalloprotease [Deltaproteobacteria bacterium]
MDTDVVVHRPLRRAVRFVLLTYFGTLVLMFTVANRLPAEVRELPVRLLVLSVGALAYFRGARPLWPVFSRPWAGPVMLLAVMTPLVANAFGVLFGGAMAMMGATQTPPESVTSTIGGFASALLLNAIVGPIGEELLFRGAVLRALRPWGDGVAVVGSSFLFGMAHIHFLAFPWAFVLGVICALLTLRAKSIGPAIAFHVMGNVLGTILTIPALHSVTAVIEKHATVRTETSGIALLVSALVVATGIAIYGVALRKRTAELDGRTADRSLTSALLSVSSLTLVGLYLLVNVALTAAMFSKGASG